jgi:uncharacterized protein (UPF0332 family)
VALSTDLIATARQLAQLHQRRPRQADLRRAISTAYYALFHGLAETAADRLIGSTSEVHRTPAWRRVYRALNHSEAKKACVRSGQSNSSGDLLIFTTTFPDLQDLRHQADYDPNVRFQHSFVVAQVDEAEEALAALQRVGKAEQLDFITLALGFPRG